MTINTAAVTRPIFRAGLMLRKHGPTIAFAAGVAGSVTSTVLACRATLKLADELPEMKNKLEEVKDMRYIDESERKKDLAYIYTQNTITVAKLYAPAAIIGVASITALTGSHVAMNRRNAALTAGYAAVSKAYDEYRQRVQEEMGEDKEKQLYLGLRKEKVVDEDGKKVKTLVADPNGLSPYARFFDECSTEWTKDPELNRVFISCQQTWLNQMLQAKGHVFLNEAYDALGLERSSAGAVVGWVISEDGDNYIDFGMYDAGNSRFINGIERSILLDFNVDGVIYDKI